MKIHHKLAHDEQILETLECDWCGNTFQKRSCEVSGKGSGGRFCSQGCDREWRQSELVGENAGGWSGGKVEVECDNCGRIEEYYPSKADGRRCCSFGCWNHLYSDEYSGQQSPFWKENNDGRYGGSWEKKREEVIERDEQVCRICGCSREEHIDEHGFDLHVHHIVPKRKFDNDIDAHSSDNLATVCVGCHYELEGASISEQKERLK